MATKTLAPPGARAAKSTIALKILMAVTGAVMVGFLVLHMYGNLKAFGGEEAFNTYAHHLRIRGEPMLPYGGVLWITRIALLAAIVGHAYAAFKLWARAGSARRTKYAAVKTAATTKWMRWGGVFLLVFIVWHLLHFTILKVSPNPDKQGPNIEKNPYQLLVASFEVPWMTAFYMLAMLALFMHLMHGVYSAQQTLGLTPNAVAHKRAKVIAYAVAVVIVTGFVLPPLAIAFGLIGD